MKGRSSLLIAALVVLVVLAAGCSPPAPPTLPGQLEWDRVAIVAESSEPIVEIFVREGEQVAAGQALVELDSRRGSARLANAMAIERQQEAVLAERMNGARPETVTAARARLTERRATLEEARGEYRRVIELRDRGLIASAALDRAAADRQRAEAERASAEAQLRELTGGTRPEQIEQAEAALSAAVAHRQELQLTRDRLLLRAPVAGRVDTLPYELGDQPAAGSSVVSLLVGDRPYARVHVPASQRAAIDHDAEFDVQIEGVAEPIEARLRSIASEPSFTPYFALVGDDASRLVYRAELVLIPPSSADLPAGLPLKATPRNER